MTDTIPLSGSRVAQVAERGERLSDLRRTPGPRTEPRQVGGTGAHAAFRSGTLRRLLRAQRPALAGNRFLVVEGYRPAGLHQRCFERHRAALLVIRRPVLSTATPGPGAARYDSAAHPHRAG
ncbi:hypothetical protein [Streptomyces sp. MUM 16J]|uniref:hypothetical protein n=1 Tax=Streptomyces sp. MUM 16J TaxID=2791988 RepID=UPI001F049F9D|nr:hypothetical protein [Streptomyces sp. MUM 16J]MCH0560493.1 hypothetical protein [Streptomyces sp. MUM 16J]